MVDGTCGTTSGFSGAATGLVEAWVAAAASTTAPDMAVVEKHLWEATLAQG